MPLSTQGRDVVQNRIDYLKRRAGRVLDGIEARLVANVEDIRLAAVLVREAQLLEQELADDAAEWEAVEVPADCDCLLCQATPIG